MQHLCARFGVQPDAVDLPLAALTRAAQGELPRGDAFALLAAVHLHIDRDRAYLVPLAAEEVTDEECDALQELLSESLARWQCDLQREHRGLWTIRLRHSITLRTVALEQASGKDAQTCLPAGKHAREWLALANEMQMLLHSHPLNARRQQSGQLAINSVWLWGVGTLPKNAVSPFAKVYGSSRILRGLAALDGTPSEAALEHFTTADVTGCGERPVCVTLSEQFGDRQPTDWRHGVERLERNWFAPLLDALRKGALQHVTLWLGNDRVYHVTADQVGRWRVRRPRPLHQYIPVGPA